MLEKPYRNTCCPSPNSHSVRFIALVAQLSVPKQAFTWENWFLNSTFCVGRQFTWLPWKSGKPESTVCAWFFVASVKGFYFPDQFTLFGTGSFSTKLVSSADKMAMVRTQHEGCLLFSPTYILHGDWRPLLHLWRFFSVSRPAGTSPMSAIVWLCIGPLWAFDAV